MSVRLHLRRCVVAGLASLSSIAMAQAPEGPQRPPRWEIGAFALGTSQQANPGADRQISRALVLPYVLYRGDVLRVDQGSAGVRALKTDRWDLDLGLAASFGARANEVPIRQGMPDVGTMVEFGPRLKYRITAPGESWMGGRVRLDLPLRAVIDVSNDFRHRGTSFEPELLYERRSRSGIFYNTTISAVVGDRRLNDTFYGVAPAFATAARPAYAARAGLVSWRLNASVAKPLNRDWRLFGFARVETVSGAANESSPLVRQTTGFTGGVGVSYTWMRSSEAGVD